MTAILEAPAKSLEPHRFTVEQYHKMLESDALPHQPRSQLINGEIYFMAAMNRAHFDALRILNRLLLAQYGSLAEVASQAPVRVWDTSEPEPDFMLLRSDYPGGIPEAADVLLAIEISDSSLEFDRSKKLPEYARSGIPEVWIVNLRERQLEIYRQPEQKQYLQTQVLLYTTPATALFAPDVRLEWFKVLS
jgi:Uma2 family endonuclease